MMPIALFALAAAQPDYPPSYQQGYPQAQGYDQAQGQQGYPQGQGYAQQGYPPAQGYGQGQRSQSPRQYPGVSERGNQMLAQALAAPDPALQNLMRQQRGVHDALVSAATASPVDVDRVASLLKQREDMQAQYRQRLDDKLLAAMRQLQPSDRSAFIRALVTPPNQAGQGGMPPR